MNTATPKVRVIERDFGELISGMTSEALDCNIHVSGISADSREVEQGEIFCAIPGTRDDGARHINQALQRGAAAVVIEQISSSSIEWRGAVPIVPVAKLREQLSEIAARFFEFPGRSMWIAGITGTNGKTSCAWWLQQLFSAAGQKAVSLGTLGVAAKNEYRTALRSMTTLDAIELQKQLAELRDQGVQTLVLEVSSHGLEQHRVNALEFDLAIFTNLSQDHLDYHGDMQAYGSAKKRLFQLPGVRSGLINIDDPFGRELVDSVQGSLDVLTYGRINTDADIVVLDSSLEQGLKARVATPWGEVELVNESIFGSYNLDNMLAVVGAACLQGLSLQQVSEAVAELTPVPGRLEEVAVEDDGISVVVDFAHTPQALLKLGESLRSRAKGRLVAVLGAGGDRDQSKRPLMAEAALSWADHLIITSDNPRHEDSASIARQMLEGASSRASVDVTLDRAIAIQTAIFQAQQGDCIAILGKGHEATQQIDDAFLPFSDRECAQEALLERRRRMS